MTSNQIEYVKHQEQRRHNLAMEEETQRSDLAKEREQARANDLNYAAATYSAQASMYNAKLNYDANIYASQLNASVQTHIADQTAQITRRRNADLAMKESNEVRETYRHNKAMEEAATVGNETKAVSAFANVLNTVGSIVTAAKLFAAL